MSSSDPLPPNNPIVKLSIPENILNETETETPTPQPLSFKILDIPKETTPKEEEGVPNISYEEFKSMKDRMVILEKQVEVLNKHNNKLVSFMRILMCHPDFIHKYEADKPNEYINFENKKAYGLNKICNNLIKEEMSNDNTILIYKRTGLTLELFDKWLEE